MKGLFIPDITVEMFKNGCLEGIEALMAEGELYDIEYSPAQSECEDAVSRADVLMLAEKGLIVSNGNYDKIVKLINDLPSVTPKPKTGRWERYHGEGELKERKCEYYDLCRNGRDENKLRESIGIAQPEPQWIPCSERLPEEGGWYIVTVNTEDEYDVCLRWYSKLHGWEWDENVDDDEQGNTIAWMPLPECYRGEKE